MEIITLLKESFLLFKIAFNDQTTKFEKSKGLMGKGAMGHIGGGGPVLMDVTNHTYGDMTGRMDTSHNNISKIQNENNETIIAFMDDNKTVRNDYLDFDGHINTIVNSSIP
jgi:hypothetical protein